MTATSAKMIFKRTMCNNFPVSDNGTCAVAKVIQISHKFWVVSYEVKIPILLMPHNYDLSKYLTLTLVGVTLLFFDVKLRLLTLLYSYYCN